MASMGPMELMMIFLMGFGGGLPLGLPPAELDPVLAQVAPEECLAYFTWSGVAAPDPQSANHTERLLAEPEVQMLVREVKQRVIASLTREAGGGKEAQAIRDVAEVAESVLTSPTAMFLTQFAIGPSGPQVTGGAVVSLGERAAEIERRIQAIQKMALAGAPLESRGGWTALPAPTGAPTVEWGLKNGYLVVGVGRGEADRIVGRMTSEAPAWLADLRKRFPVERPASLAYADLGRILKMAGGLGGSEARSAIAALGLENVQTLAVVTGLDGKDCLSRTLITFDGPPEGAWKLMSARPLSVEDLAVVPRGASQVMAARLDPAAVLDAVLEAAEKVDPDVRAEIEDGFREIEAELGFSPRRDVLAALGDTWRFYTSPDDGMFFTNLVTVADVRDVAALRKANAILVRLFRAAEREIDPDEFYFRRATIGQFEFAGETVYYVKPLGFGSGPFCPAWCILDEQFVFASYPQGIKSHLRWRAAGSPGGTIADLPAAAALAALDPAPVMLSYQDTAESFKTLYPFVQMFGTFMLAELAREGIDLDVSILPSASSMVRHMRPGTSTLRRTEDGVLMESRQTLPIGGGGVAAMPVVAVAAMAESLRFDELPSPQNLSINNLKQIGLAMHNYHDSYRGFPAAAAPMKEGQPPVSWRVRVLPFIEEAALYEEYRFGEPWDSEHNKKLLAKMPSVYRAPGSKAAADGKTNYLAVAGEGLALSPKESSAISEILDGTSHTAMVVEVADEKAVPWTKPADFAPDEKDPLAGLVGLRRRGFLAVFCDGSVSLLSKKAPPEALKAVFTRAGGEIVDVEELEGGSSRSADRLEDDIRKVMEKEEAGEGAVEEELVPSAP